MDIKSYFWVVDLLVIGLCAALAGRAGEHLLEQIVLAPDASPAIQRRAPLAAVERPRSKDQTEIVKRNVFCSFCKAVAITPDREPGQPGADLPQRTTLQLELVSTMVVPEDERWSMAVIRDLASKEKDAGLFAAGSKLPGSVDAVVVRVIEKKVYLRNNSTSHIEFLEIEGATPAAPVSAPTVATAEGTGGGGDEAIGNRVRCTGHNCEIDRGLVDQLLANTTSLATAARFVPSIRDGRPNGFKLYAIRPTSIFGRIGLQNADTIKSINGMEMSSPDQALGVYTKLRSASHLTVTVERRGETVTLDYTIR